MRLVVGLGFEATARVGAGLFLVQQPWTVCCSTMLAVRRSTMLAVARNARSAIGACSHRALPVLNWGSWAHAFVGRRLCDPPAPCTLHPGSVYCLETRIYLIGVPRLSRYITLTLVLPLRVLSSGCRGGRGGICARGNGATCSTQGHAGLG